MVEFIEEEIHCLCFDSHIVMAEFAAIRKALDLLSHGWL
jgi:hypothetical protein